ncbi:hypothetical protein [Oscillatoria salina]|uniref:hypothetical protein n=1 Tax=Oscillatoria salina TaxID=331517 RepID=UPI0013B9DA14|nr:hypothetical protein [Oscillatoria salina]MBZ8180373.1 hypothetical protein [Oscillatoria salina IIICB1]NET87971.1 hypothetical protein [Kamptonema sp. SIO1D9]
MNNPILTIILITFLLLLVLAPFAGLAPLLLMVLILGVGWAVWLLLQTLVFGAADSSSDRT